MEVRQNSPVLFRARLLRFPFLVLLPFFACFLGLGWGFFGCALAEWIVITYCRRRCCCRARLEKTPSVLLA
jgi:hypothetical protein